jgi:predicted nucleotidyltransferase
MVEQAVIEEAGRRLARAAGESAQVVLFGSHARGDGSDLRFLVVEPEVENEAEESVRLARELRDLRMPVEIVVVSRGYFDAWRNVRGSIVHSAFGDGRVLSGFDLGRAMRDLDAASGTVSETDIAAALGE